MVTAIQRRVSTAMAVEMQELHRFAIHFGGNFWPRHLWVPLLKLGRSEKEMGDGGGEGGAVV